MKRVPLVLGLVVLAVVIAWWFGAFSSKPSAETAAPAAKKTIRDAAPKTAQGESAPLSSEPSHLADTLNSPTTDIRSDLRVVADVIDAFRTNFPREGNPVGNNAEITAALTGHNRLQLVLISPKHSAINKESELCDRWGTPFFFHAESGTKMEIRSAGPDRKLWTDDDVVFTP